MTRYAMLIDLNTCVGCNACMAACAIENQTPVWKNVWRTYVHDQEIGIGDDVRRRFFPRLCNHCENPPCLTVCPTGATYQRSDGLVLIDDNLCMGCGACEMACPYRARYELTYADIREGKVFYGNLRRTSPGYDKCNFCAQRIDAGRKPACVETCVGASRLFGDLDDPHDYVAKMAASGIAQPLMPQLGTRPHVYYINEMKRDV